MNAENDSNSSASPVSPPGQFNGQFFLPEYREAAAADAVERRVAARMADAAAADAASDDVAVIAAEAADAARAAAAAARAASAAARVAAAADRATAATRTFLYTTGARSAPNTLDRHTRTNLPGGSRYKSKIYKRKNTRKYNRRNSRNRRSRRNNSSSRKS